MIKTRNNGQKEITINCDCPSCTVYSGCVRHFCPNKKHTDCPLQDLEK